MKLGQNCEIEMDIMWMWTHLGDSSYVFDMLEGLHELSVVKHQPALLGHEQLEGGHPKLLRQLLHVSSEKFVMSKVLTIM